MDIDVMMKELNTRMEPLENELDDLRSIRDRLRKICKHEDTTSWESRHGSCTEHFTCLVCGKEWTS